MAVSSTASWASRVGSLVLLLIVSPPANSQAVNSGSCPDPQTNGNFNISLHSGLWYVIQRTEPIWSELGTTCVTVNITHNTDATIEATWRANRKLLLFSETKEWSESLTVTRRGSELTLLNKKSPKYKIVDTNFESYLVLYSCSQYIPKMFYGDEIRILGRSDTMARDLIKDVQRRLSQVGLSPKALTYVNHIDCLNLND